MYPLLSTIANRNDVNNYNSTIMLRKELKIKCKITSAVGIPITCTYDRRESYRQKNDDTRHNNFTDNIVGERFLNLILTLNLISIKSLIIVV